MKSNWTKGLKRGSDEWKDLEAAYAASSLLRSKLVEILKDLNESEVKSRLSATDYESAAWAYKQADAIGFSRAITKVINLLEDTPKNN